MLFKLKSTGIGSVESEEATVILDDEAEQYFSTNRVGSMLWNRLKDGATREELIAHVVDAFDDVDPSKVEEDVETYLAQLEKFGLLVKEQN